MLNLKTNVPKHYIFGKKNFNFKPDIVRALNGFSLQNTINSYRHC